MTTYVYTSDIMLTHDTGPSHAEHAGRLNATLAGLRTLQDELDMDWRTPPQATDRQLSRVHSSTHLKLVAESIPESGHGAIDVDTIVCPASSQAARTAVGACIAGVDTVMAHPEDRVFCAVRPPGHHAEPAAAMGFCLYNSVAIAARHAQAVHGIKRIFIADFDVHHGNGTQATFENDPTVWFASSHQFPLYPGTGAAAETGRGNIINMPLEPGTGSEECRLAWHHTLDLVARFKPELVLVSAGFDAHRLDPLGGLNWTDEDFTWLGNQLKSLADQTASGRLVAALEGGYSLAALETAVPAFVRAISATG